MAKTEAPGLAWRTRKDGRRSAYWIADARHVRAGYRPKTVPLHYDPADPDADARIAARCAILQAEMLQWVSGYRPARVLYDGTFKSLVALYETDEDSPYHDLRQHTQNNYSKQMKSLMRSIGTTHVAQATGADVRRWYKTLADTTSPGYAHLTIGILKAVLSFGSTKRIAECRLLREEMGAARFAGGKPRKSMMTYAQVCGFRDAAHAAVLPSMALGLTLQYELALRQRDVIGEWIKDERAEAAIRSGAWFWRDGLTWQHISKDGILRKVTSKTGGDAEHVIADHPDLVAELERVPAERRVGPLVINERNGLPYDTRQYAKAFRLIARAAGIPDSVWSMDARAGAVTEAYEAQADEIGVMAMATHTQLSTSRRYNRQNVQRVSNVAKLRVESRKPKA